MPIIAGGPFRAQRESLPGTAPEACPVRPSSAPRLAGFVLGFGDRAELLEPEVVRKRIKTALLSALKRY